jgi:hypothetical protein
MCARSCKCGSRQVAPGSRVRPTRPRIPIAVPAPANSFLPPGTESGGCEIELDSLLVWAGAVACRLSWKGVGLATFFCVFSGQGVLRGLDFASCLGRVECSLLVGMGKRGLIASCCLWDRSTGWVERRGVVAIRTGWVEGCFQETFSTGTAMMPLICKHVESLDAVILVFVFSQSTSSRPKPVHWSKRWRRSTQNWGKDNSLVCGDSCL